MANERQVSRSNEANQNAIDALEVSVAAIESTVDSSVADPTKYVMINSAVDPSDIDLTFSGYNSYQYALTGPTEFTVNINKLVAGAERSFYIYPGAAWNTVDVAPDNYSWRISGDIPGGNPPFSLIDASEGGAINQFHCKMRYLGPGQYGVPEFLFEILKKKYYENS